MREIRLRVSKAPLYDFDGANAVLRRLGTPSMPRRSGFIEEIATSGFGTLENTATQPSSQ